QGVEERDRGGVSVATVEKRPGLASDVVRDHEPVGRGTDEARRLGMVPVVRSHGGDPERLLAEDHLARLGPYTTSSTLAESSGDPSTIPTSSQIGSSSIGGSGRRRSPT